MKIAVVTTNLSLFFVAFFASTSSLVHGIEEGQCDEEFCACTVTNGNGCPSWMIVDTEGGPFRVVETGECKNTGGSMQACTAYDGQVTSTPSFKATSTGCIIEEWIIADGPSFDEDRIIYANYTESNPAPECSETIPFSTSPTSAPTDASAAPSMTSTIMLGATSYGVISFYVF